MAALPDKVKAAWEDRDGPAVFVTVDNQAVANAIYVTCVNLHGNDRIVVADNYMLKTARNIRDGSRGSVLFISRDKKSFQVKGRLEYLTSGEIFDAMKIWNPKKHPGRAAVVLHVEQVFSGSEQLL